MELYLLCILKMELSHKLIIEVIIAEIYTLYCDCILYFNNLSIKYRKIIIWKTAHFIVQDRTDTCTEIV